jgi:hypothetical protein
MRRSLPAGTDIAASGRRPAARDGASRCATSEESDKTTRVAPDEDRQTAQADVVAGVQLEAFGASVSVTGNWDGWTVDKTRPYMPD